jgi:hypothetical protein
MFRLLFRFVSLGSAILLNFAATAGFAAGGQGNSGANVTVAHGSNGGLTATLHKGGGYIDFSYNTQCQISKTETVPCFVFSNHGPSAGGVYGTASGCPHPGPGPALKEMLFCPAAGVRSVKIVVEHGEEGAVVSLEGKSPSGDACSPVPVSVERHSSGESSLLVSANEGCTEAVSCLGPNSATVGSDNADIVKANCWMVMKPSGTVINSRH